MKNNTNLMSMEEFLKMSKEEVANYVSTLSLDVISRVCKTEKHIIEAIPNEKLGEIIAKSIKFSSNRSVYYMISGLFGSNIAKNMADVSENILDQLEDVKNRDDIKFVEFEVDTYVETDGWLDLSLKNFAFLDKNKEVVDVEDDLAEDISKNLVRDACIEYEVLQALQDRKTILPIA